MCSYNVRMFKRNESPPDDPENFTYRDGLLQGPMRGRASGLNPGNRFESVRLHVLGEHLDAQALEREAEKSSAKIATTILPDNSKTIISEVDRETSRDIPFGYSINPYRGCEHGCIYSYIIPRSRYERGKHEKDRLQLSEIQ